MADNTLAHEKRYNTHTRSLGIELYHDKSRTWYMIEVCFFFPYWSGHTMHYNITKLPDSHKEFLSQFLFIALQEIM